jgi:hypothetical protein
MGRSLPHTDMNLSGETKRQEKVSVGADVKTQNVKWMGSAPQNN